MVGNFRGITLNNLTSCVSKVTRKKANTATLVGTRRPGIAAMSSSRVVGLLYMSSFHRVGHALKVLN